MRAACRIDGVLLLDKPSGPSSNQALQRVKRLFAAAKAGHAGTLDPMASGLLPIMFGEATKFVSCSVDAAKVYEATVLLGVRTSTGDMTGEILERRRAGCSRREIECALERFRGPILQTPPMYSALKQAGQPLYRMARRGETVHREPRRVRIQELSLSDVGDDELDLRIACSKGTYIRVLAEDIGTALGCGGTVKALRRTRVGVFDIERAVELDVLERLTAEERVALLLPIDAGLDDLPALALSGRQAASIRHGQAVDVRDAGIADGNLRLYAGSPGSFLGLGEVVTGIARALRLVSQSEQAAERCDNA